MLLSPPPRSAARTDAAPAWRGARAALGLRLATAALLAGCTGGDGVAPVEPPTGGGSGSSSNAPVFVVQMPRTADTVDVGATRTLAVTLRDSRGAALAGRGILWTSSDTSVVRADTAGMPAGSAAVRGVGPGSATLTATSEGKQAWLRVTVRTTPVTTVELPRAADTLIVGTQRAIAATLRDAAGTPVSGHSVTWSSSDTAVLRAAPGTSSSAVVRGVSLGTATLVAASGSGRATVTITVAPVPVRHIGIDTTARSLAIGDSLDVAAVALDSAGQPLAGRAIAFAAAAGNTGSVLLAPVATPTGATLRVTALTAGRASVVATSGSGARATVPIVVVDRAVSAPPAPAPAPAPAQTPPPTPAPAPFTGSVAFGPHRIAIAVGLSIAVPATVTGAAGDTLAPVGVTYAVADPHVAGVDGAGRVTMLAAGTTTLTATLQGRSASLALASLAPASSRSFRIDLRFLGSPDPSLAAAARTAAARWETVIAASPGAFPVTLAAGECHAGPPAIDETIANLVIFVRLDTVDGPGGPGGNLIGSAGPCVVRHSDGVYGAPVVGVVNLDAYDLLHPTTGGTTVDVISHEIGHVLGIGTTWNIYGQREFVPGLRTGSYDYVAPHAARAAYDLGFTSSATAPVPVEYQGGGGTLGSHWRERLFVSELMTGYINFEPYPLS